MATLYRNGLELELAGDCVCDVGWPQVFNLFMKGTVWYCGVTWHQGQTLNERELRPRPIGFQFFPVRLHGAVVRHGVSPLSSDSSWTKIRYKWSQMPYMFRIDSRQVVVFDNSGSKARIDVSVVLLTESKLTLQDCRHTRLKYFVASLLAPAVKGKGPREIHMNPKSCYALWQVLDLQFHIANRSILVYIRMSYICIHYEYVPATVDIINKPTVNHVCEHCQAATCQRKHHR